MISRNRGFGLVEIMVGLVIGLICMVVIMQVASVFENQKRATTTGADAQTNGALALYVMEREIRAAGASMTEGEPQKYPPLAGCRTNVYDTATYLTPDINPANDSVQQAGGSVANVRFAPVVVSDGGGGLSDSLSIVYGTSTITAPYTLSADYAPGAGTINLTSRAGIGVNDMVALIETDPALTVNGNYITPTTCTLLQVTGLSVPPATPSVAVATGTQYNKMGGTGLPAFSDEARLYDLGQLNLVTYRVSGIDLVADVTKFGVTPNGAGPVLPVVNRTGASPLASNIVNMQAQYGVDTGNPGGAALTDCKTSTPGVILTAGEADAVVDAWVDPTGAWANDGAATPSLFDLRRIRAVRIGLVARSGVQEVPKPTDCERFPGPGCVNPFFPACSTTTQAPVISWNAGPNMAPNLAVDPLWRCYSYKVFQTTIPVRNALWSSTMNPASSASCGVRDPA